MKKILITLMILLYPIGVFSANENEESAEFTNTENKNLTAADSASLSITGTLSLQFAVQWGADAPADSEGVFGFYGSVGDRAYFIQRNADDTLQFILHDGSDTRTDYVTATALNNASWYCVLITYEPSTRVEIFLDEGCDAEPVSDLVDTTDIPADIEDPTASSFYIGAYGAFPASAANVFDGDLDDIRIWSEVHDDSSDFNCQIVGNETNLNAYWQFNDTSGNPLLDETANDNDLTNNGSVAFTTDLPFTDDCAVPSAPSFDDTYFDLIDQ